MAWHGRELGINQVYITNIGESLDKSRLFIEVLSDPMTTDQDGEAALEDRYRAYEVYRYGKTATASEGGSSGSGRLGTTPIYEEGAMWIED